MILESMRLDVKDQLATLTFTESQRGNPIDGQFCSDFGEMAAHISEHEGLRAVLIKAAGPVFSYGGDLESFVEHMNKLPLMIKRWTTTLHSGVARMQRIDAPIVACVHGLCTGGMSALVAGSDLVVASSEAKFYSAYAGIGYSCDAGSSIMYTRRMGLARARRFLLMNELLSSEEAQNVGLCDWVVEHDEVENKAFEIAAALSQGPTKAYGEIRRLLLSAGDQPLETQLELEAQALSRCASSQDAREGITAFNEKRNAVFIGG